MTGNHGVTIATAGINVVIKGLTINGRSGSGYAIRMTNGASLDLDKVTITNVAGAGIGLDIGTPARVTVSNSSFWKMNYGIRAGYGTNLLVSESVMTDINSYGITINGGSSGTTVVTASDTLVRCTSTSGGYGMINSAPTGTLGKLYLDRVTVTNCNYGVANIPNIASTEQVVALSNSFVTGNTIGLYNTSTNTFHSAGNNHVANNGTNTNGTFISGSILH
jgi:hypothetical protein